MIDRRRTTAVLAAVGVLGVVACGADPKVLTSYTPAAGVNGKSDTVKVQKMLEGITGIYVKSFQFGAPDAYADSDIEAIRKQVSGSGWSRVVGIRGKRELTEIYFWKERETNGGLVVIAAQPNELTVVNIVGRVDLASLGALGPMIPKLPGAMRKAIPK